MVGGEYFLEDLIPQGRGDLTGGGEIYFYTDTNNNYAIIHKGNLALAKAGYQLATLIVL